MFARLISGSNFATLSSSFWLNELEFKFSIQLSLYRDCFDKNTLHAHEKEWRFALIPDFERAKELSQKDPEGTTEYDEHIVYDVGNLRSIAEEIDIDLLFSDPGKIYTDVNGTLKTVENMTVSAIDRKKQIELMQNRFGVPSFYDAYPWDYLGWGSREAFRKKVLELGGGIKPMIHVSV